MMPGLLYQLRASTSCAVYGLERKHCADHPVRDRLDVARGRPKHFCSWLVWLRTTISRGQSAAQPHAPDGQPGRSSLPPGRPVGRPQPATRLRRVLSAHARPSGQKQAIVATAHKLAVLSIICSSIALRSMTRAAKSTNAAPANAATQPRKTSRQARHDTRFMPSTVAACRPA